MKPYGLVHDGHQYLLNDNDKRDAAFTKWCRSRERLGTKRALERAVEEASFCSECGSERRGSCEWC